MSNILLKLIRNISNSEKERKTSPFRVIRKIYQFFYDRPIKAGIVLNERYKVLRVIGMGSYGLVYLCKDLKTNEIQWSNNFDQVSAVTKKKLSCLKMKSLFCVR